MTHRILLDFKCDAGLLAGGGTAALSDRGMPGTLPKFVQSLRRHLVESGWESQYEEEATEIFNQMNEQLPDDDIASFVRHTRFVMDRKAPKAYLTAGYFVDSDVGILRMRIGSQSEAVLVDLGRILANGVVTDLPDLTLNKMELFEARGDQALLSGTERLDGGEVYRFFARENVTVWLPFLISAAFLLTGMVILGRENMPWNLEFFDGAFGQWYGRLVGPTAMAIVTTLSIAARDRRTIPEKRVAEWDLQSGLHN